MADKNRDLKKLQKEIVGTNTKDEKNFKKLDDIEEKLKQQSLEFKNITGSTPIEYLATMAMAAKSNESINKLKINKKVGTNRKLVESLLNENDMMSLFDLEKRRIDRYADYKMVELYIPEVSFSINMIRDSIVSPDNITKKYMNITYQKNNVNDDEHVCEESKNTSNMIKKFKLEPEINRIVRDTILLGDNFYAILKYKTEFEDYLLSKNNVISRNILNESDENLLLESSIDIEDENLVSLAEAFIKEKKIDEDQISKADIKKAIRSKVVDMVNKSFSFEVDSVKELLGGTYSDLDEMNNLKAKKDSNGIDVKPLNNINGAIIKKLDPSRVVKLNHDGICYGYLYFISQNFEYGNDNKNTRSNVPYEDIMNQVDGDFFSSKFDVTNKSDYTDKGQLITDVFIKAIEKKIDRKFITKNKEFKEQIYSLISNNKLNEERTKILYLSDEEVVHFKIEEGEDGYGTSRLAKSLFFSLIYISTLITELMTKVARGKERRVVYVDVGLDDDVEGAIQGVISDIKAKEINIESLKSISSIMKTCSSFEDYFIPKVDGEAPIELDSMPGVNTDVDTEFLDKLLKSIISGMGLPSNLVDATQEVDFSRTLLMQNEQFVRYIVSLQKELGEQITEFLNKLYTAEYGLIKTENSLGKKSKRIMSELEFLFPAPNYLIMQTVNDQIQNISSTADFITETYCNQDDTEPEAANLKFNFKKEVVKKLTSNIDWEIYDELFREVSNNCKLEKYKKEIGSNNTGDDMGGDDDLDGVDF